MLVVGLAFVGSGLAASPIGWGIAALGALVGVLAWTTMLRPAVLIERDQLVLRGMVDTVRIPLAAIEEVSVRQLLAVRTVNKGYTSPAVGRSTRQLLKDPRRATPLDEHAVDAAGRLAASYGLFVEERIRACASRARDEQGIAMMSQEQVALADAVRRRLAVPEVVALGLAVVAVVLSLLL